MTAILASIVIAACGRGSASLPPSVAAKVGDATISKAAVAHWMSAIVQEDYFESLRQNAPAGILSEGPEYASCVAILARTKGASHAGTNQLRVECAQLARAVKLQAVGYLVLAQWTADQAAERGVRVSAADARRRFRGLKAESFPTEADLHRYLARKGRTLSDEMFDVRRELAGGRLLATFALSGGITAYNRFASEQSKAWTSRTDCRAGYIVEECKEYTPTPAVGPPASVVIKRIANLAPPPVRRRGPGRDLICKNAHTTSGYSCVSVPLKR